MEPMETYYAFLLRIWQAGSVDQPSWRASLEDPHTRQVVHFASLEALCAFLSQHHSSADFKLNRAESQPHPNLSKESDL
jgi:hypothetical protein